MTGTKGNRPGAEPTQRGTPRLIFDAHLHLIDPRFPLVSNQGFVPDPFDATAYRHALAGLPVAGGAVVAGSFQGNSSDWLIAALEQLGPGFVGVAQVPAEISDTAILRLDGCGVRAVRFNLYRGQSQTSGEIERLARRVHDLVGWHSEFYLDGSSIPDLMPLLRCLPLIVIDHLGLTRRGLPHLLGLVACGALVKASGFARLDFPPAAAIGAIHRANPCALLFGSDLPGTRAPRGFDPKDLETIATALDHDAEALNSVFWSNAAALYRPVLDAGAARTPAGDLRGNGQTGW